MPNILLISDNEKFFEDLSNQISYHLPDFTVVTQEEAGIIPDMIIVDEDTDKLRELHKQQLQVPTILLLSSGADAGGAEASNIVYKPLVLNNFFNLLQAGINIYENSSDGYLNFNQYELRPSKKEILNLRNNEIIKLTEKEVAIIKYLYKAKDKIVSKNELLQEVWGYSPEVTTHTIETHIYRLRQKVEHEDAAAQIILTSDGGYQLKL
ncbi:MAG: response regulator transcription factor [Alphaproteobacteria bacterium]|nr:response regulator transcription factor [Alphaproteobacteria bacterium]